MEQYTARIMKALSGFYYVARQGRLVECRARGIFRKRGQGLLVGDMVTVEEADGGKGQVVQVAPRKNYLVRPPLANLDQLVMVISACEPQPNLLVADRLLAIAERKGIEPLLVFTKKDRADAGKYAAIYRRAGFLAEEVSNATGEGVEAVRAHLKGKISAFSGNSGVGKSSLLNRLDARLSLPTGEISQKLGRGRHTTRHVELFELPGGGYVADTPGFSSLDLERCEVILKEELAACFRDFAPYAGRCRFNGCSHTCEKGCAVLEAVRQGAIEPTRHESYQSLWNEVKGLKEWELR